MGVKTELVFMLDPVNAEKLHEEIAAMLAGHGKADGFFGVSTGPMETVRVHVTPDVAEQHQADIVDVVANHDASAQTDDQKKEKDKQDKLDSLKKPWKDWTDQDKDDYLKLLADQGIGLPDGAAADGAGGGQNTV